MKSTERWRGEMNTLVYFQMDLVCLMLYSIYWAVHLQDKIKTKDYKIPNLQISFTAPNDSPPLAQHLFKKFPNNQILFVRSCNLRCSFTTAGHSIVSRQPGKGLLGWGTALSSIVLADPCLGVVKPPLPTSPVLSPWSLLASPLWLPMLWSTLCKSPLYSALFQLPILSVVSIPDWDLG